MLVPAPTPQEHVLECLLAIIFPATFVMYMHQLTILVSGAFDVTGYSPS
jgi:hypothetical protein